MNLADRIEAGFDRMIDRARRRSGLFDHVWQALVRFGDVLGGRLAAAISYYAFFAAFSLAVLAYSILGRIVGDDESSGVLQTVNNYLSGSLPWVAPTAEGIGRGEVTAFASITLLISGIGWVETLRSSLRAVWMLDQHPGNWILRRLVDLGMLVGLGILLALSLAMTTALDRLLDWAAPDTYLAATLLRPIGPALEFLVNLVLAAAMLTAVTRIRLSPRRLVTPVLFIAVGIQLLNSVGRYFIAQTEDRPAYKLVGPAVGLLIYLYLLNQLILLGAALAATAQAGTAMDLGEGAAGLGAGELVPTPTNGATDDADHHGSSGSPVDNVGEPHEPGTEKPR